MTTIAATREAPTRPTSPARPEVFAPLTVVDPPAGWRLLDLGELWHARELIFFLGWRDVQVRYKQTFLGVLWALIQPTLMMVAFSVFFGRMAGVTSGSVPYPLFALAGLLPWTLFATAMSASGNSVVGSERLITKIYFPRLAVPIASIGAAVVDFAISCLLLGVLMAATGVRPGASILLAPAITALIATLALGVGTLLAALNVAYRDFKYTIPFLVQFGLFVTPSVYLDLDRVGQGRYGWLLLLNPMTSLVSAFRASVLGGPIPWGSLTCSAGFAALVLVVGCLYFRRVEDTFADVI